MRIRNLEIKYWQEKAENIFWKSNRPEFWAKSLVYISLLSLGSEFHQFKENTYFLRSQNPFSIKRCFYLLYTILHYSLHLHFEKVGFIKATCSWYLSWVQFNMKWKLHVLFLVNSVRSQLKYWEKYSQVSNKIWFRYLWSEMLTNVLVFLQNIFIDIYYIFM